MDSPFRPIVTGWIEKIRHGMDFKKKKFQDDADEAMSFFNGPYDFMYGLKERGSGRGFVYTGPEDMPQPQFCMTVNKVAEMVQIFGPVLYHKNPVRQVNPRKAPMIPPEVLANPMMADAQQVQMMLEQLLFQQNKTDEARARLLEHYLNYTPTATNLKEHARAAIDEAIIKGMGVLWTEPFQPAGAQFKITANVYDTVDNLVMDPDAETIETATWIARRCVHPVWRVEEEYQLQPGTLKGSLESFGQQAAVASDQDGDYRRKQGQTNDLVVYWKVWSKLGIGGRLKGVNPIYRQELDRFGKFTYLVICEECNYPLNLPPHLAEGMPDEEVSARIQWPTPYWADDAWPFTPFIFHKVPRCIWPMSHLKPGMGELKFINWAYSFLAGKVKTACRDIIAVAKGVDEEFINTILNGRDYELLKIEKAHGTISEVVQFLQHPQFQRDIYNVIQAVEQNFEKRVGLTELAYGMSAAQYRSASEAQVKADQLRVRPDDMAEKVEEAMTQVARREAFCARWHLATPDLAPVMGAIGAQWWEQFVMTSDPSTIIHSLEYRIEAGSTRKPNKDRDIANLNEAVQTMFQPLFQVATMTGNFSPVNALLSDWAKARDLDPERYLIPPMPPPPPPPPAEEEAPGPKGAVAA